ncbi:hypothetical protein [Streptomyces sp. NBC_01506]|uniref:hypothetical protein n=1 Tax=Streptomyces sp. NBC_01506 TaxID=2903887 RepID=UPI00386C3E1E
MVLLLFLVVGLIAVVGFVGYGLGGLGRVGLRHADTAVWLRSLTALLGGVAAALYTWGLIHVAGAVVEAEDGGTGSSPSPPCRSSPQAVHVIGYTVDYIPLRFVCETTESGGFDAKSVPGYVNPAALGFALASVLCGATLALGSVRE